MARADELRTLGSRVVANRSLRLVVQAVVTLAIIAALVVVAQQHDVLASLQRIPPLTIVLGVVVLALGFVLNAYRWQLLLRNVGIEEPLHRLLSLYYIGLFFSLFLPTGAGGDAVRIYELTRRHGQTAPVVVATLQERLFNLGASLALGLAATFYYLPQLPPSLQVWAVPLQVIAAVAIVAFLYPQPVLALGRGVWRRGGGVQGTGLAHHPILRRISAAVESVVDLPLVRPKLLVQVLLSALIPVSMGIGIYAMFGAALGVQANIAVYFLIVPLVWIIRLAPVSLGGLGVSEGSFVFLAGLFGIPTGSALAIAIGYLGITTIAGLFGGALLLLRTLRNRQNPTLDPPRAEDQR